MIIGIDASRANHEQRTGVEEYAFQLIKNLSALAPERLNTGEPLRFILYSDKPLRGELSKMPSNWEEKVLRWFPFGLAQGKPWRFWTQIRLSWEMLVNPPDVLFIPAHVFPIIHPKKTVMTIHDIAAVKFPQSYNWFERWYTLWSSKFAVRNLWKVIAPSEFTKRELTSAFRLRSSDAETIKVVFHGYDKQYERKDNQNINKVLTKYNLRKPYLLFVGRLEEKKNVVRIIESFENLKRKNLESLILNFQLVLVGKPGYGFEKVQSAIENSPFKNDIIRPGWVDEADLPYLMSGAKIFLFPTLYEGFGLPILEAISCGVPVLTSKNSSSEEVGASACLYVDPLNVNEIAEACQKILTDNDLRQKLIDLGFKRLEDFSWEKCAKGTLELLLN